LGRARAILAAINRESRALWQVAGFSRPAATARRPAAHHLPYQSSAILSRSTPMKIRVREWRVSAMHGYLIDMDGVIYRGMELIPGAERFIGELRDQGVPFLFLTNNSQRTRRDVVTKLQRLGIDVGEEHVFTCAMATARFLSWQKPYGT